MKLAVILLFTTSFFSLSSVTHSKFSSDFDDNQSRIQLASLESSIRNIFRNTQKYLDIFLNDSLKRGNVSKECLLSIEETLENAIQLKTWAVQMIDAWGRMPIGLVDGSLGSMGDYEQCLRVRAEDSKHEFVGQYCFAKMQLPLSIETIPANGTIYEPFLAMARQFQTPSIYNAFCFPSTCSQNEVEHILNKAFSPLHLNVTIDSCDHNQQSKPLSLIQKLSITFFGLFIFLFFVSATCDHYRFDYPRERSFLKRVTFTVKAFSPVRNLKRLFVVNRHLGGPRLDIIDGLRITATVAMIIVHCFFNASLVTPELSFGFNRIFSMSKQLATQFVLNGSVLMELFFFLGGVLIIIAGLKRFQTNGSKITLLLFSIHRWLRLTPVLMASMAINLMIFLCGNGPIFKRFADRELKNCQLHWWRNLLYISNFQDNRDFCTVSSWFLSVDMQLYLLSYFALIGLANKPKLGIAYIVSFILLGITIPATITYYWDVAPPIALLGKMDIRTSQDDLRLNYFPVYNHFVPFFIGNLTGYFILTCQKLTMSNLTQNAISVFMLSLSITTALSTYLFNGLKYEFNKSIATAFSAFFRFFWIIGFAWMVIVSSIGNGGPFKLYRTLAAFSFKPISRLCYSTSMTHLYVLRFGILSSRIPINYTDLFTMIILCVGYVVISFVVGFLFYLIIEAPLTLIVDNLLRNKSTRARTDPDGKVKQDEKIGDNNNNKKIN